jgi:hypothetical protein
MRQARLTALYNGAEELERFKREINLGEYAASLGYQVDHQKSSRASLAMPHPGTGDKIIIARSGADQHWTYFSVRDDRDNGTILDFVANRQPAMNLGKIRQELRRWLGMERPPSVGEFVRTLPERVRDRGSVEREWAEAKVVANVRYLNSRGIRPGTLASPRFVGTFRMDARGNVLFPHADSEGICGFEAKNSGWTAFATGGKKILWRSNADPNDHQLVLTESAIDALSYHQINPNSLSRYASIAGAMGPRQLAAIAEEIHRLEPEIKLVAAFDADPQGEKYSEAIRGIAQGRVVERAIPSIGKDWNDVLKAMEREYIRGQSKNFEIAGST